jgi:hypothetical protein
MKIVCEECGSDSIQTLMWVGVNTNEVGDSGPGETNDNWCNKCESHVDFVDEEEFLNLKEL